MASDQTLGVLIWPPLQPEELVLLDALELLWNCQREVIEGEQAELDKALGIITIHNAMHHLCEVR